MGFRHPPWNTAAPMLENQRHLFDIPPSVAYFDCAYLSPLLRRVREAGTPRRPAQGPSLDHPAARFLRRGGGEQGSCSPA